LPLVAPAEARSVVRGRRGPYIWFSYVEIGDPSLQSEPDGYTFTIAD